MGCLRKLNKCIIFYLHFLKIQKFFTPFKILLNFKQRNSNVSFVNIIKCMILGIITLGNQAEITHRPQRQRQQQSMRWWKSLDSRVTTPLMAFPFQSCFFSNIMIILFLFLESNIMRTLGSYYVIGIMSFGDN